MDKNLTSEKLRKKKTNSFDVVNEAISMAKDKIARGEEVTQKTLDGILQQLSQD